MVCRDSFVKKIDWRVLFNAKTLDIPCGKWYNKHIYCFQTIQKSKPRQAVMKGDEFMKNKKIGTKCVQGGYRPGNGEPRQIAHLSYTETKKDKEK